ncbi:MAG: hypothetical protein HGB08_02545 [Candidatus Moranbacteria bacterium]|nr:hypothetical protein [Candidatus Moranbacteria bacterium]
MEPNHAETETAAVPKKVHPDARGFQQRFPDGCGFAPGTADDRLKDGEWHQYSPDAHEWTSNS